MKQRLARSGIDGGCRGRLSYTLRDGSRGCGPVAVTKISISRRPGLDGAQRLLYFRSMSNGWPMTVVNWRALSLKRLAHLDELKRTGRWRRYFATEDAFEEALRKASIDGAKWKQLAYRNDG